MGEIKVSGWSKAEWREWALAKRKNMPNHSSMLMGHLVGFLHKQGARRVLAYSAMSGEPIAATLTTEFELLTTRTHHKPQRHLTIHHWETATERTKHGYLQPPKDTPEISLETVDAILLPGVAFDRQGVRLGYGGGFYDRLLASYQGLTVGVVWAELLVPQLPREEHDCLVDWLATEQGVIRAQR